MNGGREGNTTPIWKYQRGGQIKTGGGTLDQGDKWMEWNRKNEKKRKRQEVERVGTGPREE